MSRIVDERVVSMQFDNKHFENNVQTTLGSLEKLKQGLNFTGATSSLEALSKSTGKINVAPLLSAVDSIQARFPALQVVGMTAISNITNSALNAGKKITSALTIDPIKTGFSEYETQINAVQTIMANTSSKGTTLDEVNKALDELNTYADQTIYNFTQMTKNIGTFTAAGVDLETSVKSIQGIANLAAVSGSTSQQASNAMYQLSQALAAGKVSLMDWNSVVNAGMGGQVFQDALKRTARTMGTDVDALIEKYGSFRESLTQGEWLTTDVLTKTLEQFTMSAKEGTEEWNNYKKSLMDDGYTAKQAEEILKMANTATEAATKVKTFTQLFDTLKEAAQSGWSQTWEIIVGDFEEAKGLLTGVSEVIGGIINESAKARNELLQGWKDAGGRDDLVQSFKNIWAIIEQISSIGKGVFDKILPKMTVEQLKAITQEIEEFTGNLKLNDATANKLERTFSGLFSIVSIFGKILGSVAKVAGSILSSSAVKSIANLLLDITAAVGDFFTSLNTSFEAKGVTGALVNIVETISDAVTIAIGSLDGFGNILSSVGGYIVKTLSYIGKGISEAFSWIGDNFSAFDIFAGLAGGGIALLANKLSGTSEKITGLLDGGLIGLIFGDKKSDENKTGFLDEIKDKISEVLGSVGDSLQAFVSGVKVTSLVAIAVAMGILSSALRNLAGLKVENVVKALFAMGVMFAMLSISFKSITKTLESFKPKGMIQAGVTLMMLAKAIDILAGAMEKIGKLSLEDLAKGMLGVGVAIAELVLGLKAIDKVNIKVSTSIALLALAEACDILGGALSKFAKLSWEGIAKGLTAMGGALAEFVAVIKVLDKVGGFKSLATSGALLIAVQSLDELSENLKKFGELSWDQIGRGLAAMGGALAELGTTIGVLGKFTGFKSVLGATALLIGTQALGDIAYALKDLGRLAWDQIGRGLTAMGGALAELGVAIGLLGYFTGFSGILGGGALLIGAQALGDIAEALQDFGGMNWDEIGRGLTAMGGALAELGLTVGLLGGLTGFGGILGAGGILLAVQSLGDLADAMKKFGEMTWDEIGRGLVGMGGALTEVAVVTGVLGTLAPLGGLLGSGAILLAVQSLGDLADALKKFGEMSWDQIGKGLAAMGVALTELALGSFLNTFGILGAGVISEIAKPLGDLADSVKKWQDVEIPFGLGLQLSMLASGINAFTLGGFGAATIATVAEPLGVMADSVKKWQDVILPENLPRMLTALAGSIYAFTFDGLAGMALSTAAAPLGTMADSVKKWENVALPADLVTNLEKLAGAIGAFSFTALGGWSISEVAGPLGKMADSVNKWANVIIPEDLTTKLSALAEGIGEFSFTGLGGWSISEVAGPLGTMADSVNKWKDVTIPENLGEKLKALGTAIKEFPPVSNLTNASTSFGKIADGVSKLAGIDMEAVTVGIGSLGTSLVNFATATETLTGVGDKIISNVVTPIENATDRLNKAGSGMAEAVGKGVESAAESITSALETIIEDCIDGVSDSEDDATDAGESLGDAVADGAADSYTDVYNAGADLVDGFVGGINANLYKAEAKARAMAAAAAAAAKDELDEHSPSRVGYKIGDFFGLGFVNAIGDYGKKAYEASTNMAKSAKTGLSATISKISDAINSDIDTQPTIRPVLDLSDVRAGANSIGSMFGLNPSVGVLATANGINASMNANRQNGINDDVVSAINKLDKHLDKVGGTSYNINGINYNGDSDVNNAIKVLVRAAKMEGRV